MKNAGFTLSFGKQMKTVPVHPDFLHTLPGLCSTLLRLTPSSRHTASLLLCLRSFCPHLPSTVVVLSGVIIDGAGHKGHAQDPHFTQQKASRLCRDDPLHVCLATG